MGTLYLIDAHNPVLASSKINDTINVDAGESHSIRGSFVVNLPYDVPMDGVPTDLTDLITRKYQGILSVYPGFANMVYDEQIDFDDWDTWSGATMGYRQSNSLHGEFGCEMISTVQNLVSVPEICMVRFEVFRITEADPMNGQFSRQYRDISGTDPDANFLVSFNNGLNYNEVSSGVLFNIPLDHRGNQLKVKFLRDLAGPRTYLGSWAVMY